MRKHITKEERIAIFENIKNENRTIGTSVAKLLKQHDMAYATYHYWDKKFNSGPTSEKRAYTPRRIQIPDVIAQKPREKVWAFYGTPEEIETVIRSLK